MNITGRQNLAPKVMQGFPLRAASTSTGLPPHLPGLPSASPSTATKLVWIVFSPIHIVGDGAMDWRWGFGTQDFTSQWPALYP